MTARLPDWHARLQAELAAARSRPFAWGAHDCCCFAARCVDAMCGTALWAGLLERYHHYSTGGEAHQHIEEGGGLQAMVAGFLGEPVPWGRAAPGDLVLVRNEADVEVVGVCEGPQVLVATTPAGYAPVPIGRAVCAWRVG